MASWRRHLEDPWIQLEAAEGTGRRERGASEGCSVPTARTPSKHDQTCNDPGSETRRKPSLRRSAVLMQVRQDARLYRAAASQQERSDFSPDAASPQGVFSHPPWALSASRQQRLNPLWRLHSKIFPATSDTSQHRDDNTALQLQAPQDPVLASPLACGLRTAARLLFPHAALRARRACISGEPVSTRTTWIPDAGRRPPTPEAESARCDSSMRCRRGRRWRSGGS